MENAKDNFQPYEGGEPYIFASYSHADSAAVLPILDALRLRGFRVWYDQGIGWTEKWKDVVADHVARCGVCMAFVSAASRASKHCDAELNFADSNDKPILRVYLADGIRLSPGLEMYLSQRHSIKWKDFPKMADFLDRLEQEEAVLPCKVQPVWHYDGGPGGIRWTLSGDGALTIAARNPSYPAKMPDYKWDGAAKRSTAPWMREWENIVSVAIERGITTIGDRAFSGCTGLTAVSIPDSVTSIGNSAFDGCTGLTAVSIPDSVIWIGSAAFRSCTGLTAVSIPDSVISIVWYAFDGCTGLTAVSIPDSVTKIGDWAFLDCTGLTAVSIPDSVTAIDDWAFGGCTGLTAVSIPDSVTKIGNCAFYGCTGLTAVSIPDSVTSIEWGAFHGCTGLTAVSIPDSVTEIGGAAFRGCAGLTAVTIPDRVTYIGTEAFKDCENLKEISLPAGVTFCGDSFAGIPENAVFTVRQPDAGEDRGEDEMAAAQADREAEPL